MLSVDSSDNLTVVYAPVTPYYWKIYNPPVVDPANEIDSFMPSDEPYNVSYASGLSICVAGFDSTGTVQLTPGSNTVVVP